MSYLRDTQGIPKRTTGEQYRSNTIATLGQFGVSKRLESRRPRHQMHPLRHAGNLRRPPRGFPADHEFVEDLKLRDLGSAIPFTDKQVCSPKFMTIFVGA